MKKILAMLLALVMLFGLVACGGPAEQQPAPPNDDIGANTPVDSDTPEYKDMGTIMWLSNLTDGIQYEVARDYMTAICEKLGYELTIVYGSMMNDAAENLQAVQNGMTKDVVGLVTSQDGGIAAIMEEYPELWVCGYNTDMRSVYAEGGVNAACLENDHFLGTICDGYGNGTQLGVDTANGVIEKGYKKISVVNFPFFAYPNLTEATVAFMAEIEKYNAGEGASAPIEIVGEPLTLEFQPLAESYFLEEGHGDLDAIVALCAGVLFVYPTMKSAMANGTCASDTVLLTGGFDNNPDIVADIGEGRTISWIQFSPAENPAYALVMIDNAMTGNLPADVSALCVDGAPYTIDSIEDIENVMSTSMAGTGDVSLAQLSVDEVVALCGRNNPDLTQAKLIEIMHSEQLSVDALKDR